MKSQPARLKRTENRYEFLIRYPYGTSAVNGYRRAARHFGLHTLEDPTTVGTDTFRLLIHKSAKRLREAARILNRAYSADDETLINEAETWLAIESDIHWFDHDWKYWNQEQDEGALEQLGWKRIVVQVGNSFRVTLLFAGKRGPD
jgi:hypothetical protein